MRRVECEPEAYFGFYSGMCSNGEEFCLQHCESFSYEKEISEAKWPSPRYFQSFFDTVIASRPDRESLLAYTALLELNGNSTDFQDSPLIRDNFARLNVFFSSSDVLLRSEKASYESSNLLSDLGGTIGLWAGLSFLTVIELIAFCAKLIALPFAN
jgi:hypothetical protein